jgi:membrane protein DedA with SNARE-associated domain
MDDKQPWSDATEVVQGDLESVVGRDEVDGHASEATGASGARRGSPQLPSEYNIGVQSFLIQHGYLAVSLLAFLQASVVPLPSEITFGFAGVLAHQGHLSLFGVIILGTVAETAGSFVAYSIGRFGGRPLVERVGRYMLITPKDLDRAELWLDGKGEFAVALGRAMPLVRLFTSVIAGIAEMKAIRFGICSFIGTALYVAVLSLLGYAAASQWNRVLHDFALAGWVIAAVVIALGAFGLVHRIRSLRGASATEMRGEN